MERQFMPFAWLEGLGFSDLVDAFGGTYALGVFVGIVVCIGLFFSLFHAVDWLLRAEYASKLRLDREARDRAYERRVSFGEADDDGAF